MIVITPLGIEMKFLVAALKEKNFEVEQESVGPIEVYQVPKLKLTLVRGGHGKVACALKTQEAIFHLKKVEAVVCAGAGGRIADGLQVADVVVGEEVVEHDYYERFSQTPQPRFSGDKKLLEALDRVAKKKPFMHFGVIASGDEDIVENGRAKILQEKTSAMAVAWEGAGVARAAQMYQLPFAELRGITDGADENAMAHFQENIKLAMWNIAEVLIELRS